MAELIDFANRRVQLWPVRKLEALDSIGFERELAKRQREQDSAPTSGGGNETVTVVQEGDSQTPKQDSGDGSTGSGGTQQNSGSGSTPDQQCLQDADTGQYICQTP